GVLPDSSQRPPLDVKIDNETSTQDFIRKKLTFASHLHSRVSAILLTPRNLTRNAAAIICFSDNEPGSQTGLQLAEELVKRGYVCLAPENSLPKEDKTYASGCMKTVWDNIRGIDFLETIPEISYRKIGIIGHGLGGLNALLTAAFDSRISA